MNIDDLTMPEVIAATRLLDRATGQNLALCALDAYDGVRTDEDRAVVNRAIGIRVVEALYGPWRESTDEQRIAEGVRAATTAPTRRPRPPREPFDPRLTDGRAKIDRYRAARAEERGNELRFGRLDDQLDAREQVVKLREAVGAEDAPLARRRLSGLGMLPVNLRGALDVISAERKLTALRADPGADRSWLDRTATEVSAAMESFLRRSARVSPPSVLPDQLAPEVQADVLRGAARRLVQGGAENVVLTILRDASAAPEDHSRLRSTLAGLSEDELIRFDGVEGQLIRAAVDAAWSDEFVVSNTIQGRLPGSSSADAPSVVEYRSNRLRERGDRYPEGQLSDRLVEHRRSVEVREAVIWRLDSPRYGDGVRYADSVRDAEEALGVVDHDLMRTAIALEVGTSELTARVDELERVMESAPNRAQRALTAASPGIAGASAFAGVIAVDETITPAERARRTREQIATSEQEVSAAAEVASTAAADFRARLSGPVTPRARGGQSAGHGR